MHANARMRALPANDRSLHYPRERQTLLSMFSLADGQKTGGGCRGTPLLTGACIKFYNEARARIKTVLGRRTVSL